MSGHEGNHARQVVETRKYVAAFRSAERAITVAGLGVGDRPGVPTATRELLSNADYVIGSQPALAVARPWIRAVELELRPDNRDELVNRLVRDIRAGLWSMVVTLGDPAESAPGLISQLERAVGKVSMVAAPGFYRLALDLAGISPLDAACASVERIDEAAGMPGCSRPGGGGPGGRARRLVAGGCRRVGRLRYRGSAGGATRRKPVRTANGNRRDAPGCAGNRDRRRSRGSGLGPDPEAGMTTPTIGMRRV